MEAKHTPGPWSVMAGDNYEIRSPLLPREYPHHCKEDSTGDFVAYVGNHAPDFGEANANLIATAPDLLRSLIDCEARLALLVASGRAKMLDAVAAEHARAVIAAALGHNIYSGLTHADFPRICRFKWRFN